MPYPYDRTFASPFPTLPVILHPVDGVSSEAARSALVDTGADATLAPAAVLRSAGAIEIYTARLRSHWGELRPVAVFLVDLEVAGLRLPGVEVVSDETGDAILLGRNVLNKLALLLDGPRATTELLTR